MSHDMQEAAYQAELDERWTKPWKAREEAERSPSRFTRYNPEQWRRAAELERRSHELLLECGGRHGDAGDHDAIYFDGPDGQANQAEYMRRWKEMVGL